MASTMDSLRERTDLGKWNGEGLSRMLGAAAAISGASERIESISGQFLGTPYEEGTLIGAPDTPEEFVIRLDAVDCFTYLDYVEAMRLSCSFEGFKEELRTVRYRQGVVTYATRFHFFTDWAETPRVKDVTADVGRGEARAVKKALNRKDDGSPFLPGIPERMREVTLRYPPRPSTRQ